MPLSLIDLFDQLYPARFFYILSFQEPGVAEAQFAVDIRAALKRVYFGLSGDAPLNSLLGDAARGTGVLEVLPDPPGGPLSFMSDADLDLYASTFERTGMTGGFNRYRALAFEVDSSADILGATVDRPSYFIGGERDVVRGMIPGVDSFADPGAGCTDFRGSTIVPGAGHWVQQEAPDDVNAAIEHFLATL